ncbi:hypothetical protein ACRQ5D_08560 [Mucilaginibacter sp. P25]|uniref:hypothetical protein n=1 Tax=unclassified Mucilaginibacter TaxID=2617802 RepID=UPI003D66C6CE
MNAIHNKDIGTKQKALAINLNPEIYGSFAEIGAGQDVAANFFKAGASSGTIAKTMSAYDMLFSDAIYGVQQTRRYVSEPRLMAMLGHEYGLIIERLGTQRGDTSTFLLSRIPYRPSITTKQMKATVGWAYAFSLSRTGSTMMW